MRSKLLNIRKQIAELRAALLASSLENPSEAIELQLPGLQEAAAALELLQAEGLKAEPGARQELEALTRELGSVGRLIAQGREFLDGWARLLASSSGGYRPDGEPTSPALQASISVKG